MRVWSGGADPAAKWFAEVEDGAWGHLWAYD